MKKFVMLVFLILPAVGHSFAGVWAFSEADSTGRWVGTWSTAPQLVEPGNMPPSPGLTNNALRQKLRVSIGGDSLRMRFSNEFSSSPVTMMSVQLAVSTGGHTIDVSTNRILTFGGVAEVTMAPGAAVISDPIAFDLTPRMDVAVTIFFGQTSATVTGHPGSRTTSYILTGNDVSTTDFTGAVTTDHWYVINTIDVLASPPVACVAILGNSITDGRGSTTNGQDRWPDIFSEELLKDSSLRHIGVLNQGIGGNAVLSGGLGPTAVNRFERDILNQSGVKWAIVFEGVNDIGVVNSAIKSASTANNLIAAYTQMIESAHARNITIFGATIMPFKGNGYYNQYSEQCRNAVNQWIRAEGNFDACIDFDKAMRDPADSTRLASSYQNDGLHPDVAGHKTMGESVDLRLFAEADTGTQQETGVNASGDVRGYELGQNYPNPFNPATTMSFNLPTESFVTLKVYDTLGREVSHLIAEHLSAGTHSRQWRPSEMAGGVYYYQLLAGPFVDTRKLIFLR